MPLTEVSGEALQGSLSGGPFEAGASLTAASVSESFAGGPSCGIASGRHKAKAVKSGSFSTSPVRIEPH